MSNTAIHGALTTAQVRSLAEADGQAALTAIQVDFVRRVRVSHIELAQELMLRLKTTGYSAADQATAYGTVMTALQAVTW
jgi:hypothetical protein